MNSKYFFINISVMLMPMLFLSKWMTERAGFVVQLVNFTTMRIKFLMVFPRIFEFMDMRSLVRVLYLFEADLKFIFANKILAKWNITFPAYIFLTLELSLINDNSKKELIYIDHLVDAQWIFSVWHLNNFLWFQYNYLDDFYKEHNVIKLVVNWLHIRKYRE